VADAVIEAHIVIYVAAIPAHAL